MGASHRLKKYIQHGRAVACCRRTNQRKQNCYRLIPNWIQYHTVGTALASVRKKSYIKSNSRTTARVVPTGVCLFQYHFNRELSYIDDNQRRQQATALPCKSKFVGITIPPSCLRQPTSLYTREAEMRSPVNS